MAQQMAAFAPGSMPAFLETLWRRLDTVMQEGGLDRVVVPIGLFLVLAKDHGGDDTADELIRRFHVLHLDSSNAVDFYFLGWRIDSGGDDDAKPVFSVVNYTAAKTSLRAAGVGRLGGNADLILLDAEQTAGAEPILHFESAVQIDLTKLVNMDGGVTLGAFLEDLLVAARAPADSSSPVWHISDRLGLVYSRDEILKRIWTKLGGLIGAERLSMFATKGMGEPVPISRLYDG